MVISNKKLPILANHKTCTGCRACGEVCPKGCISFIEKKDGFFYPQINNDVCIKCHSCERVCPVINYLKPKKKYPTAYAAWTTKEARIKSASGGVFFAIASQVLEEGGYVSGAVFDGYNVKHIITKRYEDLEKIQGTKYFQSETYNVYREIKRLLNKGDIVLFGGTSCQVAGLLNVVGEKRENLITIDLICFGVPSLLTIKAEERIRGKKLKRIISNRDKCHDGGWQNSYYMTCEWDDGTTTTSSQTESFMLGSFCSGKVMRKSCYNCLYKTLNRQADLTIGDYHCVKGFEEQKTDGISLVFVNSQKGADVLENCPNLIKHERELNESLLDKRTIYYNDSIYGKRLVRLWMPFLLKYAPPKMLSLLYHAIVKSKNPLVWPLTTIDVVYYLINKRKAKRKYNSIQIR